MEALQTQLDNLQWELNCLDAENRRLREANDGAVVLFNLQAELKQSKQEVATLMEQLETSKRVREVRQRSSKRRLRLTCQWKARPNS